MISHSQKVIFSPNELILLKHATKLATRIEDIPNLRCHEVARAIGYVLRLPIQDGYFGYAEHSWLWTESNDSEHFPKNILDVYTIGSLPQVQLISMGYTLPHNENYMWEMYGTYRKDIDEAIIAKILKGIEPELMI
jgi:hypothetical protein